MIGEFPDVFDLGHHFDIIRRLFPISYAQGSFARFDNVEGICRFGFGIRILTADVGPRKVGVFDLENYCGLSFDYILKLHFHCVF